MNRRFGPLTRAELPPGVYTDIANLARETYIDALRLDADIDKALVAVFLTGAVQGHYAVSGLAD